MSPRGQRVAKGADGATKVLTGHSGLLVDWVNKMEATRPAQIEAMPLRRPWKEIDNNTGLNGPTWQSKRANLGINSKAKSCDNSNNHVPGKVVQLGCEPGPIGPIGLAKKINFGADSNGNASVSSHSQVPGPSSPPVPHVAQANRSGNAGNFNARGKFGSKGSWTDKVRASSARSRFCLDSDLVQEHGRSAYSMPDEFIEENFGDWTRCLVGFIPGSPFPFHAARAIALREWKNYGIESVQSYEGFFIFRFQNEEKSRKYLLKGHGFLEENL